MFRTLTARLVLVAFVLCVAVVPASAHAPALTSARMLQDAVVGEPVTVALVAVSAAAGPAGIVVAGAVGLTAAGFAIAENWSAIEGGLKSFGRWLSGPSTRERQAQAEQEALARAEQLRQSEAVARQAAAQQRYRAQVELLAAARSASSDAQRRYDDGVEKHAGSIRSAEAHVARDIEAIGADIQRSEAVHNEQVAAMARRTNELVTQTQHDVDASVAATQERGAHVASPLPQEVADHPDAVASDQALRFSTQPADVGYGALVKTDAYVRAAARSLRSDMPHVAEKASNLALVELAVEAADSQFDDGMPGTGLEILQHVERVVDDVFDYDRMRDQVSAGSTFLAGIISGATGLPGQPLRGYARAWLAGRIVGAGLGLVADATALSAAIAGAFGSGGLAVASGGVLAPAAAVVAGECATLASLSIGAGGLHMDVIEDGVRKLNGNSENIGRLRSKDSPPEISDVDALKVSRGRVFREGPHFDKHGRGMGFASKKDYRCGALEFLARHLHNADAKIFRGWWQGRSNLNAAWQLRVEAEGRAVILDAGTGQVIDFYVAESGWRGAILVSRLR